MIEHLQVETTSVCNAHCVFCPHERLVHVGHMEQGLYEKIVRDAGQYDLKTFTPMLTGEPFCDSDSASIEVGQGSIEANYYHPTVH